MTHFLPLEKFKGFEGSVELNETMYGSEGVPEPVYWFAKSPAFFKVSDEFDPACQSPIGSVSDPSVALPLSRVSNLGPPLSFSEVLRSSSEASFRNEDLSDGSKVSIEVLVRRLDKSIIGVEGSEAGINVPVAVTRQEVVRAEYILVLAHLAGIISSEDAGAL
jgi:hypothetical protein